MRFERLQDLEPLCMVRLKEVKPISYPYISGDGLILRNTHYYAAALSLSFHSVSSIAHVFALPIELDARILVRGTCPC